MKKPSKVDELVKRAAKKPEKTRVNIYVTEKTHERFKKACRDKGLTVSQVLDTFMEAFAERHG